MGKKDKEKETGEDAKKTLEKSPSGSKRSLGKKSPSGKVLTADKRAVLNCYVNTDPSHLLPEQGAMLLDEEQVQFLHDGEVCKEWPWGAITEFAATAGKEKGEFDKFNFEVLHEGSYEVEAESCDHFEGAFHAKAWNPKQYKCLPTKEQLAVLEMAFGVFDDDGSGSLDNPEEVDRVVKLLGKKFIKKSKEVKKLVENAKKKPVTFKMFMAKLELDQVSGLQVQPVYL
jgi:hypothetical protein